MARQPEPFDPGSLDLRRDPFPALRRLREAGPVARGRIALLGAA